MIKSTHWLKSLYFTALLTLLTACGENSSSALIAPAIEDAPPTCETGDDDGNDPACGKLLISITDADGDFLNYQVNVNGLELIRADGTVVSVLTTSQSVNFVDYVDVSELAAAATIPAGIYTSGRIEVDYSNSDIQVEKNGIAESASMVDDFGNLLASETLELQFDESNRLVIVRNRPAMLEIDFNLSASHQIDLQAEPITITTEPYIVAEIDPVISKEFRLRGPLIRVNQDDSFFRIAVRPFHRRTDRFGGVNISTNEATNYQINGTASTGTEGLALLAALDPETPTLTLGQFSRGDDRFTAITVLAGSSVPGSTLDAARGVIVARDDNQLTIKGASLIRTDGSIAFDDQITVLLSDETNVTKKRRLQDSVSIADLSVGQAVTVLGTMIAENGQTVLDATDGFIRMRLTAASGHSVNDDGTTLNIALQALQSRRPDTYDFTGTGMDESFDANPADYEVAIDGLLVATTEVNSPVRVTGFVSPFGSAPADFNAISVTNYSDSRSQIYANWPDGNDINAFTELLGNSMTINTEHEGGVYKLIQGGIRTDLTSFSSAVVISSNFERGLFTIKSEAGVTVFSSFSEFLTSLQQRLNEGRTVDLIHGVGGFSSNDKTLNVIKLAVKLN